MVVGETATRQPLKHHGKKCQIGQNNQNLFTVLDSSISLPPVDIAGMTASIVTNKKLVTD